MQKTLIYLIRHAQSKYNRDGSHGEDPRTIYGMLGSPLTETGCQQAVALAQDLKELTVASILTSHLTRARQTADALGEAFNVPVQVTETLQELLDGEQEQEAGRRLLTFLQQIVQDAPGQTAVVVTHGGILRGLLILRGFTSSPELLPPGSVANAGYVVLEIDGEHWAIKHTHGVVKGLLRERVDGPASE